MGSVGSSRSARVASRARSPLDARARASDHAAALRASSPPWRRSNALDEPSEGVRRRSHGPIVQRKARTGEPGELCLRRVELRNESRDLPERDPALALALERRPSRGRLRLVLAIQDERLAHVVPAGDVEQSRPEVVVLALRERRVVAQAVLVQHRPVDDDRRVEERRREQGRPPHGARAAGHPVDRAEAPVARRGRSSPSRRRRSRPRAGARASSPANAAGRRRPRPCAPGSVPAAASSPTLSAPARPSGASLRTTRTRGSATARTSSPVASAEPSSTTTSSRSRSVWPSTLATASSIVRSASRAARTTDTRAGATAR